MSDPSLPTTGQQDDPPAFGIMVYVSQDDSGAVVGRVANLECESVSGLSERSVLQQIVSKCKKILREATQSERTPDWIDPPLERLKGEQKRFLPMHL